MLALYIWSSVLGGGMVIASLLGSLTSHSEGDHGHDGDHDHDGGHDHDGDHDHGDHDGGHDAHAADDADTGHDADHDGHDGHDESSNGQARAEGPIVLAHHGHEQTGGDLGALSFLRFVRPTSHFLAGFGLTGLLAAAAHVADPVSASVAAATGAATMLIGRQISKLRSHTTSSDIGEEDLLGREADVVIPVGPGDRAGKVRVFVKGSAPDFVALPARADQTFAAGEKVFVIQQMDDGVLKVDRKL